MRKRGGEEGKGQVAGLIEQLIGTYVDKQVLGEDKKCFDFLQHGHKREHVLCADDGILKS